MNETRSTYLRYVLGVLIGLIGVVFMFIPFIPIGYLLIFMALFILSPKIPFLKKYVRFLKRKDKDGRLNKLEKKINDLENYIDRKTSTSKSSE
ncbi:hypothetical protein [Marinoscillum furvescens]|uniref:Uncharacterized protein n=1 Tax=Marinoscillum furvescens DSM 4134 TaxID=1122208 RepID=A0A3D9L0G9_MARFU|nr:hypothetical protein [Marinoscillum furvescens]RED94896.1 hypothetical protein C7460_1197 [Marinoscillum furvescens DSM 4134]